MWADDYVAKLTEFGVPFVIRPGWKSQSAGRGNWTYGVPIGTVDHNFVNPYTHTSASAVSMLENGYSGGPSPFVVCQYIADAIQDPNDDGLLFLISCYPTGHPGKGSRAVLNRVMKDQAPQGDAGDLGLPDDLPQSEAERLYYGTEVQNPGDGTPLTKAQHRTLTLADAAFCAVHGYSANRVIQHREHSGRKKDIHRDALNAFTHRGNVAAAMGSGRPANWWDGWFGG